MKDTVESSSDSVRLFSSSCLTADSTLAIISVVGMFSGVTAKFRPFFSRAISVSLRDLEDKY